RRHTRFSRDWSADVCSSDLDQSVLELEEGAMHQVMDLNFFGTLLPTQVFLEPMVAGGRGAIVNVSSMAAAQAITRVAGYSAAKEIGRASCRESSGIAERSSS